MKHADVIPGREAVVNSAGDLGMDGDLRDIIGERVRIIKLTSGGSVLVSWKSRLYVVPPRNLTAEETA